MFMSRCDYLRLYANSNEPDCWEENFQEFLEEIGLTEEEYYQQLKEYEEFLYE